MRDFCIVAFMVMEKMNNRPLDNFDRKLLHFVQHDVTLTSEVLAEHVGLSASAVQRRLKRLQEDGFIAANIAVLNPALVGNPNFFIVALEVEREQPELLNRLRHWLASKAQIQQVYYVTGTADFMLVLSAENINAYDELMQALMKDNPNVRRFSTNVVLGIHKQSLFLPVE
jgi:Lrp/AsnC family transcriptional regulator, leucine-responsive regulatory protein